MSSDVGLGASISDPKRPDGIKSKIIIYLLASVLILYENNNVLHKKIIRRVQMKNYFRSIALCLFALLITTSAFASIGTKENGLAANQVSDINFVLGTGATSPVAGGTATIPILDSTLLAAGTANGGATSMTSTELAVPTGYAFVRKAIANDAAFIAGTLANGKPGQILTIYITTVNGGSQTFTITPTTKTGFTSVGLNAAADQVTFLFVDTTVGWVIIGQNSVTVTP